MPETPADTALPDAFREAIESCLPELGVTPSGEMEATPIDERQDDLVPYEDRPSSRTITVAISSPDN